jgi:CheY-like chemotaxis protein
MTETRENKVVLVMDDEKMIRSMLVRLIKALGGMTSITAASVEEGFKAFTEEKIDLIISDLSMPGETGIDMLARVRATGSKVPLMIFSGSLNQGEAEQAVAMGANKVLNKPAPIEELIAAIQELLGIPAE